MSLRMRHTAQARRSECGDEVAVVAKQEVLVGGMVTGWVDEMASESGACPMPTRSPQRRPPRRSPPCCATPAPCSGAPTSSPTAPPSGVTMSPARSGVSLSVARRRRGPRQSRDKRPVSPQSRATRGGFASLLRHSDPRTAQAPRRGGGSTRRSRWPPSTRPGPTLTTAPAAEALPAHTAGRTRPT